MDPIMDENVLTVVISQSGETADTLAAQREAKLKGSPTIAICNVIGSMVTREAAGTVHTHAGPEIGVASTKAFTSQLAALFVLAVYLGRVRNKLDDERSKKLVRELFTRIDAQQAETKRWREEIDRRFTSLADEHDPADDVPPHWGR